MTRKRKCSPWASEIHSAWLVRGVSGEESRGQRRKGLAPLKKGVQILFQRPQGVPRGFKTGDMARVPF